MNPVTNINYAKLTLEKVSFDWFTLKDPFILVVQIVVENGRFDAVVGTGPRNVTQGGNYVFP